MSKASLDATFISASQAASPVTLIMLEQSDWSPYSGVITNASMVTIITNMLFGEDEDTGTDCGLTGGNMITGVRAYPYTPDLGYTLFASYGTLSERVVEEVEQVEIVNFQPANPQQKTKYPIQEIISTEWIGDVYDANFNLTAEPAITQLDKFTLTAGVFGGAEITYKVIRHSYTLTIEPREDAVENLFSATAFAVYSGGIVWIEIDAPPGAEEYDAYEGTSCGRGGSSKIKPWEGAPGVPDDTHANRYIVVDYCQQEVHSDVTYES